MRDRVARSTGRRSVGSLRRFSVTCTVRSSSGWTSDDQLGVGSHLEDDGGLVRRRAGQVAQDAAVAFENVDEHRGAIRARNFRVRHVALTAPHLDGKRRGRRLPRCERKLLFAWEANGSSRLQR